MAVVNSEMGEEDEGGLTRADILPNVSLFCVTVLVCACGCVRVRVCCMHTLFIVTLMVLYAPSLFISSYFVHLLCVS